MIKERGDKVKVNELVRYIKKQGCLLKRNGKEHDIWINPNTGGKSSIPRHSSKEIPTGTVKSILKDLGLK